MPNAVVIYHSQNEEVLTAPMVVSFTGTILFVDISGFTPLSARLTAEGWDGVEKLSTILNDYFDKQIEIIVQFGGDITKFAGDALIAVWREDRDSKVEGKNMPNMKPFTPQLAVQAAVCLTNKLHDYETQANTLLSIKSGIGFGNISEYFVGGINGRWEYLCSGDPLDQVGRCEHQCTKGDIVVSQETWPYIDTFCEGIVFEDTGDVKIREIVNMEAQVPEIQMTLTRTMRAALASYIPSVVHDHLANTSTNSKQYKRGALIKQIPESSNGLSEMFAEVRTVTVIFVSLDNLGIDCEDGVRTHESLEKLQGIFTCMQTITYKFGGVVRQFLLDDKGCVFIAVFGLVMHENDAERGVRAAMEIPNKLDTFQVKCSIGVTTGRVFCGVVGNEYRCEFAIIGSTVNLSARLMAASKGKVYVCSDTFSLTRKAIRYRAEHEITLKGLKQPVIPYVPLDDLSLTSGEEMGYEKATATGSLIG